MDNNFRGGWTIFICTVLSLPSAFLGLLPPTELFDACASSKLNFAATAAQGISACASGRRWFAASLAVYIFAWCAYIATTSAWVNGFKMPVFAIVGTAAAFFYFVPLVAVMGANGLAFLMFLPTVAPAIWLATRALRFHLS